MAFLEEHTLMGELCKRSLSAYYNVRHKDLGYIRKICVLSGVVRDKNVHDCGDGRIAMYDDNETTNDKCGYICILNVNDL